MLRPPPPVPRIPRPVPRRLPHVKRRTIALGILASDGVVIAADTEEATGDSKRDQEEILWDIHPDATGKRALLNRTGFLGGPIP
jgi:hypothetical protein